MRKFIVVAAAVALSACANQPSQDQVAAKITQACLTSGMFKPLRPAEDVAIMATFPVAQVPVALARAGVDKACADPAKTAADAARVAEIIAALGKIWKQPVTMP